MWLVHVHGRVYAQGVLLPGLLDAVVRADARNAYCVRMGGLWEIARILPCVCTQEISSQGHLHARSGTVWQGSDGELAPASRESA